LPAEARRLAEAIEGPARRARAAASFRLGLREAQRQADAAAADAMRAAQRGVTDLLDES
jgi:hypothetical protein